MLSILLVSALGFIISFYAFFIERRLKLDPNYKPVCDLSDTISCSKPVLSKYGKLFVVANSILGMLFYASMFIFAFNNFSVVLFIFSFIAALASLYFAYILFFKIRALCLLCIAIYIINILLLVLSYQNL